jgi:ubiquitin-protein ligase
MEIMIKGKREEILQLLPEFDEIYLSENPQEITEAHLEISDVEWKPKVILPSIECRITYTFHNNVMTSPSDPEEEKMMKEELTKYNTEANKTTTPISDLMLSEFNIQKIPEKK